MLPCVASLIALRRRQGARSIGKVLRLASRFGVPVLLCCLCLTHFATGALAVNLATYTTPDNGTAGINNVNITGSGFPVGTITPANIVVTFATTCGGAAAATTNATSITTVVLSTKRVNVLLPGSLVAGDYAVPATRLRR